MWPYWLLFLIPAFRALAIVRTGEIFSSHNRRRPLLHGWWLLTFIYLILMIGLRHEVGADWRNYLAFIDHVTDVSLSDALKFGDPAYSLLNWVGAETMLGIYFVNVVCATLFSWGLLSFCRIQPKSWLAFTVAIPYLVIVVAMGYSRQGVAVGLAMLGLVALEKGRVLIFVLWIICATAFHKSAFILIPFAVLSLTTNRFWKFLWLLTSCIILIFFLILEGLGGFVALYIDEEMESSGAFVRILMNAFPAFLFLVFIKRFKIAFPQKNFWYWMAYGALSFILLLKISPSSTAVDRTALYWIPFQLFFWSRLPDAICLSESSKFFVTLAVVAYSALTMLVWMFFAVNADAWIPYNFYPTFWLWN